MTTVHVTHDQVEAMTMGHRVAVLKDGVLQQCDTPHTFHGRADNLFVAGFIGSPAMNLRNTARSGSTVAIGGQRAGSPRRRTPPSMASRVSGSCSASGQSRW